LLEDVCSKITKLNALGKVRQVNRLLSEGIGFTFVEMEKYAEFNLFDTLPLHVAERSVYVEQIRRMQVGEHPPLTWQN
jgi:hypothetical protein